MVTPYDYITLGWKIFPCHTVTPLGACTCGKADCASKGKHPRTPRGVKDATSDSGTVASWMMQFPVTNWGLACGIDSGILAIDIDPSKGGDYSFDEFEMTMPELVPGTLMAKTGGGGRHIIYSLPSGANVGNPTNWLQGVDIRGTNGYIVVEPSVHLSGGTYQWINWPIRPTMAPDGLIAAIVGKGGGSGRRGGEDALPGTDDILNGVPEGNRDDHMFRLACRLRRQLGDNNRRSVEALVLMAARNSSPPFPDDEAIKCVNSAFNQDHEDNDILSLLARSNGEGVTITTEDGFEEVIYELNDAGNTQRFIKLRGTDFRYIPGIGWKTWSDLGWIGTEMETVRQAVLETLPEAVRREAGFISDVAAKNRMLQWAKQTGNVSMQNSVVSQLMGNPEIKRTVQDFITPEDQLACRNGMVNLRDGSIRSFHREDLVSRRTSVFYNPGADQSRWLRFLWDSTQGDIELMEYLQIAAGYTLTGSVAEESFFIISGKPASGKSTYMDGLISAMGEYADDVAAEVFIRRKWKEGLPREEAFKMYGTRLITTSELPEGARFDDALLKKITGGDTMSARKLYSESFTFQPEFKLWMTTNHDPRSEDKGIFRRAKRVPFNHVVPEPQRDSRLKDYVKDPSAGGEAVLAWAVTGAMKYYAAGKLVTPSSIIAATEAYQQEQDIFLSFLSDTFTPIGSAPHGRISLKVAYELWRVWCDANREYPGQRGLFKIRLADHDIQMSVDDNTKDEYVIGLQLRTDVPSNAPYIGFTT